LRQPVPPIDQQVTHRGRRSTKPKGVEERQFVKAAWGVDSDVPDAVVKPVSPSGDRAPVDSLALALETSREGERAALNS